MRSTADASKTGIRRDDRGRCRRLDTVVSGKEKEQMSHGSAHQERAWLAARSLGEQGLASMQDLKDDTSLRTRSSTSHEACECCPTRGQACTPANPRARQVLELMPAGRMLATLVVA